MRSTSPARAASGISRGTRQMRTMALGRSTPLRKSIQTLVSSTIARRPRAAPAAHLEIAPPADLSSQPNWTEPLVAGYELAQRQVDGFALRRGVRQRPQPWRVQG